MNSTASGARPQAKRMAAMCACHVACEEGISVWESNLTMDVMETEGTDGAEGRGGDLIRKMVFVNISVHCNNLTLFAAKWYLHIKAPLLS
jgi:hypothetical protein